MKKLDGPLRILAIPALLALASGFGLIATLLTEGGADILWTAAAALPLAAVVLALRRSAAEGRRTGPGARWRAVQERRRA